MDSKTNDFYLKEPVGKLILKFAIPSITALIVASLYNIVDQIFIGHGVGYLGNAATNVVYPITIIANGIALFVGDGCAAYLSICQGKQDLENAQKSVGNALTAMIICAAAVTAFLFFTKDSILWFFGATSQNISYTQEYFNFILIGIPFAMLGVALPPIVRADGNPRFAMISTLTGCIINVILDPIAIFALQLGMKGAAIATVFGQIMSATMCVYYLFHAKSFRLGTTDLILRGSILKASLPLGVSSFLTQVSIMVNMTVMNNILVKYGDVSKYGADIPLSVVGIVQKVFGIVISVTVGIAAGSQPIIENPKPTAKEHKQKELAAAKRGVSWKERLRQTVDRVLPDCRGYDDFLAKMRAEGYEIKEGKNLSFRAPGQERFTRSSRLGTDYTREALRDRFAVRRGSATDAKKTFQRDGRKINLLIDIQAKMAAGKGAGYEHWAKIFNLKEAAKTLNFLIENGLTDYDELAVKVEQAGTRFDNAARRIKQLEGRMAEVAQLKTHIINYSKTREIYAAYKKSRHKKEFLAEHGAEIAQHEAAKKAFDALGGKPIPKVAQLSEQYAALLAEKQKEYDEYRAARQDMIAYQTAKANVDKILGLEPEKPTQGKEQEADR